jgi:hypothetical protein
MVARPWLALAGAALAGSACALVIGARELPEGAGGTTATSWPTTGVCSPIQSCRDCLICMVNGVCADVGADAGCAQGTGCHQYLECVDQCPQDNGYATCAASCGEVPPMMPGYASLQACACAQCVAQCPDYCP